MQSTSKLIPILASVGTVAIVGLAVVVIVLVRRPEPVPPPLAVVEDGRGTLVTPDNVAQLDEEATAPIPDAYYTSEMSMDWHFPDGSTQPSPDAYVKNAVENTRTIYFDLIMEDTEELLYSSPYIPVGESLRNFALEKDFGAGEYSALVVYHLVDDDHQEITTVSVRVTLYVT